MMKNTEHVIEKEEKNHEIELQAIQGKRVHYYARLMINTTSDSFAFYIRKKTMQCRCYFIALHAKS